MNKKFFRSLSLQRKLTMTFLITSTLIFVVNLFLFMNINRAINRIDEVYDSNVQVSDLSSALGDVHTQLTEYLNTKSSASLGDFYKAEGDFRELAEGLEFADVDENTGIMISDISAISEHYLDLCETAVTSKRGRDIKQYRESYASASELYSYLEEYIYSINNRMLQDNSVSYAKLRQSYRSLELISMLVLVVVTIINLLLVIMLVQSSTSPLTRLSAQAGEVSRGNFDVPAVEIVSEDEIGVVTAAFNDMVVSIRGYIQKLKESMELENSMKERELLMNSHLKEAELKYLQAQINPHFLFNTLNAGAQLSMMENADSTYRYLQNVASFFRTKTNRDNQVTTLAEEVALVDNYIYIINVRFSGAIAYEKNIDEDLVNVSVPSMILQPIIENAVNHGVRDIDWPARITLSIYETGNSITISVRDNGKGMNQQQIEALLSGETKARERGDETNGVGLSNVVNRLKLFYDSDDVFDITSAGEGKGTEVLLYIPVPE